MDSERDDLIDKWSTTGDEVATALPWNQATTRSIDDPLKVQAMVARMKAAKESGAIVFLTKIKHFMHDRSFRVADIFTRAGFDSSGDGALDEAEFRVALNRLGMKDVSTPEVHNLLQFFDKNHDGQLDEDELELALHQLRDDVKKLQAMKREASAHYHHSPAQASVVVEAKTEEVASKTASVMLDIEAAINRQRGAIIKGVSSISSYRSQGDKKMYTLANIAKRKRLRANKKVTFWLDKFWRTLGPELTGAYQDESATRTMSKAVYTLFFTKVAKVLLEPEAFEMGPVRESTSQDWDREFGPSTPATDADKFQNSLFETIDIWTTTATEDEYVFFASELFVRITHGAANNRSMRDLDDITHWAADDRDFQKKQRATDSGSVSSWQSRGESSVKNDIKDIMELEKARQLAADVMGQIQIFIQTENEGNSFDAVSNACKDRPKTEKKLNAALASVAEDARIEYERQLRKQGVPREYWQNSELDHWLKEKATNVRSLNEGLRTECLKVESKVRKKIRGCLRREIDGILQAKNAASVADDETTMPGTVLNQAAGSIDDQSTRSVEVSLSTGAKQRHDRSKAVVESPKREKKKNEFIPKDTVEGWLTTFSGMYKKGTDKLPEDIADEETFQKWFAREIELARREEAENARRKKKAETRGVRVSSLGSQSKDPGGDWVHYRLDLDDPEVPSAFLDDSVQHRMETGPRPITQPESHSEKLHAGSREDRLLRHVRDLPGRALAPPLSPRTPEDKKHGPNARPRVATPLDDLATTQHVDPVHRKHAPQCILPNTTGYGQEEWLLRPSTTGSKTFGYSAAVEPIVMPKHPPGGRPNRRQRDAADRRAATDWLELRGSNESIGAGGSMSKENTSRENGVRVGPGEKDGEHGGNLLDNWTALENPQTIGDVSTNLSKPEKVFVIPSALSIDSSSHMMAKMSSSFHASVVSSVISESSGTSSDENDEDPLQLLSAADIYGLMDTVEHQITNRSGCKGSVERVHDLKILASSIVHAAVIDASTAIQQAVISPFSKAERYRPGHRYDCEGKMETMDPAAIVARSLSVRSQMLMKRGRSLLRKERALYGRRRGLSSQQKPQQPPPPPRNAMEFDADAGLILRRREL
jgi:hypothetical protein